MIVNDGNKKLCDKALASLSELRVGGMYQTEMAEALGVHRQYISMVFRRRFDKVPLKAMEQLLEYFGIEHSIVRDDSGLLTLGELCR